MIVNSVCQLDWAKGCPKELKKTLFQGASVRVFLGETTIWIRRLKKEDPCSGMWGIILSYHFSRILSPPLSLSSSLFPLSVYRSADFCLFLPLSVRLSVLLVLQPSTLGFIPVSSSFLRPLHADWIIQPTSVVLQLANDRSWDFSASITMVSQFLYKISS